MPRWWVFPPRAQLRLFHRRDDDGLQYVVRSLGTDPGLNPAAWTREDIHGTWTAPGPRPPIPGDRWRGLGGKVEELSVAEIDRRHRLRPCPDGARPIGVNQRGEEVREHDGRRWIILAGTDRRRSWTGDEIAHPPTLALRFGSRQAWTRLARHLVDLASRGQLSLDDDELAAMAAAAVDAGRRPSFRPWMLGDNQDESPATIRMRGGGRQGQGWADAAGRGARRPGRQGPADQAAAGSRRRAGLRG